MPRLHAMTLNLFRFASRLSNQLSSRDDYAEIVATRPSFAEWIVMVGGAM